MTRNSWLDRPSNLAELYLRHTSSLRAQIRFELTTRILLKHLSAGKKRIVDVGGGSGEEAMRLARVGHSVLIVDPDPEMIAVGKMNVMRETQEVRARIEFIECQGEQAGGVLGRSFDAVCCHSVLVYLEEPSKILQSLVDLVKPGGVISLLSLNPESSSMRWALQGQWAYAKEILRFGSQARTRYSPVMEHRRATIVSHLSTLGATTIEWYGVGIFSSHLEDLVDDASFEQICELEWLAAHLDPYRLIARSFQTISCLC